ncbi:MAG: secondary thiamine-phosphate synthase enzyme YjbQ [Candidatus Omnitrophota bacterium]
MSTEFSVQTNKTSELVDVTSQVRKIVSESGIDDGICVVYIPHTTACVCINENADPCVKSDISRTLEKLIPRDSAYTHCEGNSDAHIKSSIIGSSRVVFIESNKLCLGRWQGIYLCEFDGPRMRRVKVKIIGS